MATMWVEKTFLLRNMLSNSCLKLVVLYFEKLDGVELKRKRLGEITLVYNSEIISQKEIEQAFETLGFSVIKDANEQLVEAVKVAAIELIFYANNVSSLIRNSDYISDKVQEPYEKISKVFSASTGITLEKYIILLKIERAKELISSNEFTLSEISYMLGYSSVQYLSNQFKKITGYTVSQFKNGADVPRIPVEKLI